MKIYHSLLDLVFLDAYFIDNLERSKFLCFQHDNNGNMEVLLLIVEVVK
ncbi:hypothetical protein [Bacillus niameyensis]|nr:hypothetical protein [Bacillus niameyensis]